MTDTRDKIIITFIVIFLSSLAAKAKKLLEEATATGLSKLAGSELIGNSYFHARTPSIPSLIPIKSIKNQTELNLSNWIN